MSLLDSERRVLKTILCLCLGYLGGHLTATHGGGWVGGGEASCAVGAGGGGGSEGSEDGIEEGIASIEGRLEGLGASRGHRDVTAQAAASADAPYVLLGVISNPPNFKQRALLRRFNAQTGGRRGDGRVPGRGPQVGVEFVVGSEHHKTPPARLSQKLAAEVDEPADREGASHASAEERQLCELIGGPVWRLALRRRAGGDPKRGQGERGAGRLALPGPLHRKLLGTFPAGEREVGGLVALRAAPLLRRVLLQDRRDSRATRYSRDVRYHRDAAEMQPRCGRDVHDSSARQTTTR